MGATSPTPLGPSCSLRRNRAAECRRTAVIWITKRRFAQPKAGAEFQRLCQSTSDLSQRHKMHEAAN
jgi:hypothetical protein